LFLSSINNLAKSQLPTLIGTPDINSTDSIPESRATSKPETNEKTKSEKKYQYLTWFMECNYLLIPASLSSGTEIHFEFINRVKKKMAMKPSVGIGGGYTSHVYNPYHFDNYSMNVKLQRVMAHFTLGARLVHRLGGLCLRVGYNFTMGFYDYDFKSAGITNPDYTQPEKKQFHRIQYELVGFKSFTKKKPGVGVLLGIQFIQSPVSKSEHLLVAKAGIAF